VEACAAEAQCRAPVGRVGAGSVATRALARCASERAAEITAATVSALARLRHDDGGRAGEDRGLAVGCTGRCAGDVGAVAWLLRCDASGHAFGAASATYGVRQLLGRRSKGQGGAAVGSLPRTRAASARLE